MFCPYLNGTGIDAQGGHAEYMLMNVDAAYLIPDKVSYEQAAPIFCAGYTVHNSVSHGLPPILPEPNGSLTLESHPRRNPGNIKRRKLRCSHSIK
jgi:NADPH:quinone reductase-like Zn-dependent oxidoreductase